MTQIAEIISNPKKTRGRIWDLKSYSVRLVWRVVFLAFCISPLWGSPWVFVWPVAGHSDVDPEVAEITLKLAEDPDNVDLLLRRGQLYRFNREFNHSLEDLNKAWLLDPDDLRVSLERCRTLIGLGYDHEAESGLDQYLRRVSGTSRVVALVERAQLYARSNRAELAIADFSEALTFYPTVELYIERGHLQEGLGQFDLAVAGYREGLSHLPQAKALRRELIRAEIAQGHYPNALTLIDEELASVPVKTEWYLRRAEVLAAMGQTEASIIARNHALAEANRTFAKRPTALHRVARAKVYQALGELEAAKQELRLAVEKAPRYTEAQDLLRKLESQ